MDSYYNFKAATRPLKPSCPGCHENSVCVSVTIACRQPGGSWPMTHDGLTAAGGAGVPSHFLIHFAALWEYTVTFMIYKVSCGSPFMLQCPRGNTVRRNINKTEW